MARLARIKLEQGGAFYYIYARTAGLKGEYPLQNVLYRRTLLDFIEKFSRVYCCSVLGFCASPLTRIDRFVLMRSDRCLDMDI